MISTAWMRKAKVLEVFHGYRNTFVVDDYVGLIVLNVNDQALIIRETIPLYARRPHFTTDIHSDTVSTYNAHNQTVTYYQNHKMNVTYIREHKLINRLLTSSTCFMFAYSNTIIFARGSLWRFRWSVLTVKHPIVPAGHPTWDWSAPYKIRTTFSYYIVHQPSTNSFYSDVDIFMDTVVPRINAKFTKGFEVLDFMIIHVCTVCMLIRDYYDGRIHRLDVDLQMGNVQYWTTVLQPDIVCPKAAISKSYPVATYADNAKIVQITG